MAFQLGDDDVQSMNEMNLIPLIDIMLVLMIIFLFVAISYMVQVKNNQKVLEGYMETKENLHDKLVDEFKNDTTKWQMSIGKDLTIKFDNPTVLFDSGEWELTSSFKNILQDFLPRYFNILLKESQNVLNDENKLFFVELLEKISCTIFSNI